MLVSADTSDLGPEMWGWARLGSAFWGGGSPPAMGEKAGRGGRQAATWGVGLTLRGLRNLGGGT